jgi:hypothetical protein
MPDILLNVPYFSQRDNAQEWWRTCNTSSCAMCAEAIRPGCLGGSDDRYFEIVQCYGDTTDHEAQTQALESIGIQSKFRYDLDYTDLDRELERKRPIVIGVYHKGTIQQPAGGHMIVVVGRSSEGYLCHDPWGEGFDYSNENGEQVLYPKSPSLDARWLTNQPGTGWGRVFD